MDGRRSQEARYRQLGQSDETANERVPGTGTHAPDCRASSCFFFQEASVLCPTSFCGVP